MEGLKEVFELPKSDNVSVRSQGSRRIYHKHKALQRVLDRIGTYISHLTSHFQKIHRSEGKTSPHLQKIHRSEGRQAVPQRVHLKVAAVQNCSLLCSIHRHPCPFSVCLYKCVS